MTAINSKLVDLVEHTNGKFPIFASLSQSVETEALVYEKIIRCFSRSERSMNNLSCCLFIAIDMDT